MFTFCAHFYLSFTLTPEVLFHATQEGTAVPVHGVPIVTLLPAISKCYMKETYKGMYLSVKSFVTVRLFDQPPTGIFN